MGKSLVIVESPAKAKTINKYLGSDFIVKSSIGHIRDLPSSSRSTRGGRKSATETYPNLVTKAPTAEKTAAQIAVEKATALELKRRAALANRMGIDPYNDWQAQYEIVPGKEKVVAELKALANKVDQIYLATDLDREGEAIAWHLQEVIGGEKQRYRRVVFNEITSNAIRQAFETPGAVDLAKVQAQQARRFLDRVVGYMISPLLWKKVARGLSAGRVQSVAVQLVVERERDIKAFLPQEYWELHADLQTEQGAALRMQVIQYNQKPFKPSNEPDVQAAIVQLQQAHYELLGCEVKPSLSKPPTPFITSTLQQTASTRIGFSVRKTMVAAQHLYEAGYITYMRTDSTNISQEALNKVRHYIQENFGNEYLPEKAHYYRNKGNAQEAHEAIRPSDINIRAEQLKGVDSDARKLYQLIWCQFVACQMAAARYQSTTLTAKADDFLLKAKGLTLQFDGWTRVAPASRKDDEQRLLPVVKVPSPLLLQRLDPSQHFTKPPARYGEAALVKELEKREIGRPSTYAAIISTIQERGYVRSENRRFYAEKMGEIVTDRLAKNFQALMSYDFTARMEAILDDIAHKKIDWKSVLNTFFTDFTAQLEVAEKDPDQGGMQQHQMVLTDLDCSQCGRKMGIRTASTGVFLGCSGYTAGDTDRCKHTVNLIPEAEVLNILEGDKAETAALRARRRCKRCETAMDSYLLDSKNRLYVCGSNPLCEGYEIAIRSDSQAVALACDKCGSEMYLKTGRFGKYMGCGNNKCRNTRKILRDGSISPPKEDPIPLPELQCSQSEAYFVLRQGAAGLFLAANTFPKSRESRSPLVEELVRFKAQLPEKLHYLTTAPVIDPQGNRTVVRFSRKTKQHYISTEKTAKAGGWSLSYVNGQWKTKVE